MQHPEESVDEFDLISRFFKGLDTGPAVTLGNGDDAAVLRLAAEERLAVSVDTMVEDVHFPAHSPADLVAYRAVAAAASDLAAMGARPVAMTLALTIPSADTDWLKGCRRGLERAVETFAMPLVGGDLTRGPLTLSVQVMGVVDSQGGLRRDGARVDDRIFVSACLGDAAAGLAVLSGELSGPENAAEVLVSHFWKPCPALELGMAIAGRASSALDVSDGLLADAGHIAAASGVCLRIDSARVPLSDAILACVPREQALEWALAGGEDYALCFTLPPDALVPDGVTEIGAVVRGAGVECDMLPTSRGFRHFS